MKTKLTLTLLTALLALSTLIYQASTAFAQDTAFTYQGRLQTSNGPANGTYDLQFAIYDLASGSSPIAGPIVNPPTLVSNGLFTVTLNFGAGVFDGDPRWLQIAVRTNGVGVFETLTPRQSIASSPYAIKAAGVDATGISGTISPASIGAGTFTGTFSGVGSGLTGLNASELTGGTVPTAALGNAWRMAGNAGTTAGTQFLGTTDNQPLVLKVNNQRGLRLEPTANTDTVNVIGGSARNFVGAGVVGVTLGGGGAGDYSGVAYSNSVLADFGVVGGGRQNTIAAKSANATIAGGTFNDIGTNAVSSAIGGGFDNSIAADSQFATIAGGSFNDIGKNSDSSAIGGGNGNDIAAESIFATIAGGNGNIIGTNSDSSTIGGGNNNNIAANSHYANIAGGGNNTIDTASGSSAIGGGFGNTIAGNSQIATIVGGAFNDIGMNSHHSAIGGGEDNGIALDTSHGTIAGGFRNDIGIDSDYSAIGGGYDNGIGMDSHASAISGGAFNNIGTNSDNSVIGGGIHNNIAANSAYATIPGGDANSATNYAFAAGRRAKANHTGAFVWADSTDADFISTAANQFLIRALGGVGIGINNPAGAALAVAGGIRAGVNGTIQSRVQFGTAAVGTGTNGVNTFTITFPSSGFLTPPKVFVTARGVDAPDTFVINTRAVTTTQFKVNIIRVDANLGWGQSLQVDWYAVE